MGIRCVKKPIDDKMYDFKLYIAYESKSKKLICHSDCLKDVELYLTANDLLDKVEIFDSDNDKFNEVFTSCYGEYGLVNPLLKPFNKSPILLYSSYKISTSLNATPAPHSCLNR